MIPNVSRRDGFAKDLMKAFYGRMECVTAIAVTKWNDENPEGARRAEDC